MRPSRKVPQALGFAFGLSLAVLVSLPALAQTAPGASRSILAFPRPGGFPNPAFRVTYARADEAPPLMVRTGENTFEPLYRRTPDGGYAPARAAGYRIAMTSCPSITTRADYRSRMIDLAAAEWAYFGLPILDMAVEPAAIVPRVPQPSGVVEIISPQKNASIGDRVLRRAPRLGLSEDDYEVSDAIAGYWAATGSEEAMRVQSIVDYGWDGAGWAMPWSAAFISWLACEAGLSTAQFRRSGGHIDYVRAAVRARDGQDPEHAFIAYDLGEATPDAGDLLCTARSDSTFRSIADVRNGNSSSNALHCDLVVKTDTKHNRLYAIGGNVNHAVTMSVIATDAKGRPLTDADVIGAHRWFAVLKARAGGNVAHDLDGTPTVQMLYRDYARYAGARRGQAPVPLQSRGGRAKADAASP